MSCQPQKTRHSRQPSNRIPVLSDYESDAATAFQSQNHQHNQHQHVPYEAPPLRTNTELNLSVLQRYVPSIHAILSLASNVVVYTIDPATAQWVKSSFEGTMFVCAQHPLPTDAAQRPRACVFILNRKGVDNVVIDLARVSHAEAGDTAEMVCFKVDARTGNAEDDMVLGIWVHNDKSDTRSRNWAVIQQFWNIVRGVGVAGGYEYDMGPATMATGRRLSLSDLFAKQGAVNVPM